MMLTEQVKILDDKIKANKSQYDLDREAAKISALSSGELEKYEYLTGKDLGYKPDVIQKAKFEYSPLGKVFNKGLDESDKKEGLLKRLKSIEDKSGKQLKMIENKRDIQLGIKSAADIIGEKLSPEAENILAKVTNQEKLIQYKCLYFKPSGVNEFDFREYDSLKEVFLNSAIYYRNLKIEDAEGKQHEFLAIFNALERYNPRKPDYVTARKNLLINVKNFYNGREMIINTFKNKIFPLSTEDFFEDVHRGDKDEFYTPRELATIPELPNSENEEETPRGVPDLESENSVAQNRKQKAQGLKILTPEEVFSRLPISLAQLKAGNDSQKHKNEIRQLLYSLYRSKKVSKTIYNNLINAI